MNKKAKFKMFLVIILGIVIFFVAINFAKYTTKAGEAANESLSSQADEYISKVPGFDKPDLAVSSVSCDSGPQINNLFASNEFVCIVTIQNIGRKKTEFSADMFGEFDGNGMNKRETSWGFTYETKGAIARAREDKKNIDLAHLKILRGETLNISFRGFVESPGYKEYSARVYSDKKDSDMYNNHKKIEVRMGACNSDTNCINSFGSSFVCGENISFCLVDESSSCSSSDECESNEFCVGNVDPTYCRSKIANSGTCKSSIGGSFDDSCKSGVCLERETKRDVCVSDDGQKSHVFDEGDCCYRGENGRKKYDGYPECIFNDKYDSSAQDYVLVDADYGAGHGATIDYALYCSLKNGVYLKEETCGDRKEPNEGNEEYVVVYVSQGHSLEDVYSCNLSGARVFDENRSYSRDWDGSPEEDRVITALDVYNDDRPENYIGPVSKRGDVDWAQKGTVELV